MFVVEVKEDVSEPDPELTDVDEEDELVKFPPPEVVGVKTPVAVGPGSVVFPATE